jgi:hypothetical protein
LNTVPTGDKQYGPFEPFVLDPFSRSRRLDKSTVIESQLHAIQILGGVDGYFSFYLLFREAGER